jgi:putative chitinase
MLTESQLRQIMPNLRAAKAAALLPHLNRAMAEYAINSAPRAAAFVAQLAHESGEFRWMEEIWGPTAAQRRYEPETDLSRRLGNTAAGDGKRFKGRGPIQLTGRANYLRFGGLLGVDLVTAPEQAVEPAVAFRVAALYWANRGLNELADAQNFRAITRRINGGFNGLADRQKYFERARTVLATGPAGAPRMAAPRFPAGKPPAPNMPTEPLTRGFEVIRELTTPKRPTRGTGARKTVTAKTPARKAAVMQKPASRTHRSNTMTIVNRKTARRYIAKARFPSAPKRPHGRARGLTDTPPVELKSTEAQSLVVGSGLVVAAANVPKQTREDLVNCTLFAQLAASGEVGSAAKVVEWYDAYFRALTALGWAQSDTHFENYKFGAKNAEAHKAIMQVLTVLLGPQAAAIAVVKTALEALQSMNENSPWITLFDRQSKSGKSARFQVATAQIDASGLLQVALVAFNLKAKSDFTQVLFFRYSASSTRLQYAAGKATIYEAALAEQRDAIAARLSGYRRAYVGAVRFPAPPAQGMRRARARGR